MADIVVRRIAGRAGLAGALAAFVSLAPAPASALDAAGYVAKYQALAAKAGFSVRHGAIEDRGDGSFIVRDLEIRGGKLKEPAHFDSVAITGAREAGDGDFIADTLLFSGFSYTGKDEAGRPLVVTIEAGEGQSIHYPDPSNLDAPFFVHPRASIRFGPVSVSVGGGTVMTMEKVSSETEQSDDASTYRTAGAAEGIVLHAANLPEAEARARLAEQGIERIELALRFGGSWNMETGRLDLTRYVIDAPQFGKLDLSLAFDGYTRELAADLRKASAAEAERTGGDGSALDAATGSETGDAEKTVPPFLKQAMARLRLVGGRIVYEDRSLAGRILDFQAGQMGASRQDLVDMAFGMTLGAAQVIDNPAFSLMLAQSIRTFLQSPGTFSVSIAPKEPATIAEITGMALMSPSVLIERLGVEVKANE